MITLGADPEFFVQRDGVPEVVVGQLGGTKGAAIPMFDTHFGIQEDNVMAEWNIPPAHDADDFSWYIDQGMETALRFVRTKMGEDVGLLKSCAVEFPVEVLQSKQARTFGCSPDFDAYRQGAACTPINPSIVGNWRFAGGHVHIGFSGGDIPKFVAAAFCDAFIGLWSIQSGDVQGKRRELYGSPGRYRPTEYGIEYRVLSNFWTYDPVRARNCGYEAWLVGSLMESDPKFVQHWFKELPWGDIRNAISREDRRLACDLVNYIANGLREELQGQRRSF